MKNHIEIYGMRMLLLSLLMSLTFATVTADQIVDVKREVAKLVAQMPAQTHTQQREAVRKLLDLGSSGTAHLLRHLGDVEADDNQARLLVSALAKHLGKDRQSESTLAVEKHFTDYLVSEKPPRAAQTFVLNQLQFFVSEASIESLAGLITDVCFPVVRILTSIGTSEALDAMLAYSEEVPDQCNAAILQACVQLQGQCNNLAENYREHGLPEVASAAHRAMLINVQTEREKVNKSNLDLQDVHQMLDRWEARASKGDTDPLKNGILRLLRDTDDRMVAVRASVLAKEYMSEESTSIVSKAMRNMDGQHATEVIGVFHGSDASLEPFYKMTDDLDLDAQIALASLSAERGDVGGLALGRSLLSKPDDDAKIAGLRAISSIQKESALPELISFLKQAKNKVTAHAATSLSSQYITKGNVGILKEALHQSNEYGQEAALELVGRRGLSAFFGDVLTMASSSSDAVRDAVFSILPDIASPDNYAELINLCALARSELNVQHLASALVRHYDASVGQREQLKGAFDTRDLQEMAGMVMASIGDQYFLDFVHQRMLETGGYPNAAQNVILKWSKPNALELLSPFISDKDPELQSAALERTLALLRSLNPTQQLLKVRDLMELEIDASDQMRVLTSLGRLPTIQVFHYLEDFLNVSALQKTAASTLLRVGMTLASNEGTLNAANFSSLKEAVKIVGDELNADDAARIHLQSQRKDLGHGYRSLFNGKDLEGWQGLVGNPISRSKMSLEQRRAAQLVADSIMHTSWFVEDGILRFDGDGYNNLTTVVESFENFELIMDWKIEKDGDSGIYLKGTPQVQIWDPMSEGNQVGSGGLFNNQVHSKVPGKVADNPVGEWNSFHIKMVNDHVTVYLNGELVTDDVVLENYWDRKSPLFRRGPVELQAHTTPLYFRDIYVRPIEGVVALPAQEQQDDFVSLFNGVNLDGWIGNKTDYVAEDGEIRIYPTISGGSGNLFTANEYDNFILRFEFRLTPGANNGLGVHAPLEGDVAYLGKELQILDNTAEVYAKLKEYQYHGSAYGVVAAKRGFLRPVGEWNEQEVQVVGNSFKVTLNDEVILEADLDEASKDGTLDGRDHPGLNRTRGHIGFLGHGSEVHFRNLRIKEL